MDALAIRKILVPTDFSDCAAAALDYALGLARLTGASIELCHCGPVLDYNVPLLVSPAMRTAANDLVLKLAEMRQAADHELAVLVDKTRGTGVPVTFSSIEGVPDEAIVRHAREGAFDLIVIGSHGRRGLSRMILGSTSERVVRSSPCPILVVHPEPSREP